MNKHIIILILFSVITSGLASCTTSIKKLDPPLSLTLNEAIRVPPHSAQIMIQNGKIKSNTGIDQYAPYCRLEMKGQKKYPRTIQPGTFLVTGISRETDYVMSNPVKVASLGFMFSSGITDEIYSTTLYLKSATQNDVELITCEWWEDAELIGARHLTMQQIQQTLAPLFDLEY